MRMSCVCVGGGEHFSLETVWLALVTRGHCFYSLQQSCNRCLWNSGMGDKKFAMTPESGFGSEAHFSAPDCIWSLSAGRLRRDRTSI